MNKYTSYCKSYFFGSNNELFHYLPIKFDSYNAISHFSPDHKVEPEHLKVDIEFDFDKEKVSSSTTISVVVKAESIDEITLDAKNLVINKVLVNNTIALFENDGKKLRIFLENELVRGAKANLEIQSQVDHPAAGVYFIKPSTEYPNKHMHVWTQAQDEDASFFIPCFDHPSFKQTTEVIVRNVPQGMIALSNGKLISNENGIYNYKFDALHSIYLLSIVVGNFQEIKDQWDNVPVSFYVHPDRVSDGHRAFDKTKKMVQFYSEFTGFKYPYSKYSQIAVSDFIFGGMENTTVTTQTDLTLHDEKAHLDFSSDGLVAHELAHQWFGDLLTCKEWAHAWLNESFATYFQALFFEYDRGKDEFDYQMFSNAEAYFAEDENEYRRPIVYNKYSEPIELFDSHLYPGGSWRLHMLRQKFGTEEFRKAINYYIEQNKYRNVETIDLQRAFERSTGSNVDSFFDQWLYKAGYPIIEFDYSWEKQSNLLKATVKQIQNIETGQIFTFNTEIKIVLDQATEKVLPITITEKEQTFFVTVDKKPLYVSFDNNNKILKKLIIKANATFLKNQILYDKEIFGRIYAIRSLAKEKDIETIKFLGDQLQKEKFWGVQNQISDQLASLGGSLSEGYLIEAVTIKHPKARRNVVKALGTFIESTKTIQKLTEKLKSSDESYYVEAEVSKSLGLMKDPSTVNLLKSQLSKESHQDIIRQKTLEGLSAIQSQDSFDTIIEWTKNGKPILARITAIVSLAKLGKLINPDKTFDLLTLLTQDYNFRIKMATITAFEILGNRKAMGYLMKYQNQEADGRLRNAAYRSRLAIQKQLERPQELDVLKDEISKLREENRAIKESISKLEHH